MRKRRISTIINALLAVSLLLSGCGGSSSSKAADTAAPAAAADYENFAMAEEASADSGYYDEAYDYSDEMVRETSAEGAESETAQVTEDEVEGGANQKTERMLIKNVYMSVESEDIDAMMKSIERRVDALGGYIENMNVDNTKYSNSEKKTATILARVPVEKLDAFVDEVEGQSNVLSKSSNAEDVTLKYVDMQSRMDSLQIEYDRISELLKQADELDNIIELENRLTDIRYEMQSYGSQMKVMKNQARYSTVNLNITQVIEYTPVVVEEKTRLERMSEGFVSNCKRVGNGIVDFFVGLVIALPILLVWAVIITIIVLIIRLIVRKSRERHPRKEKQPKNRGRKQAPMNPANPVNPANPPQTETQAQTPDGGNEQ